ncbi:hypothetical protein HOBO_156 [Bacillus phage Hobo]|uniref:Uncharacterized protein n=2 Tax=Caeruleovirus BM15 TaxID=1985178 RepID=A0A0S2MUP1_9CAUD|nr:hypothetical protein FD732_gp186 [Bacillus phage BM15]ALO79563.1 hypothetical protein BM10_159 [Bacillus phage BM15]AXQ66914.1 hypothetical protein HOBO_156 [Bacillus phage Hobo]
MIKAKAFEKWIGTSGYVSDPEFDRLTELLSKLPVVDAGSSGGLIFASETMVYATADEQYLRLTYQVRTPKTPMGMKYTYYFGEA